MSYFTSLINSVYPRILTQLNRDPNSTTYGCFDRNWWHYKIRDYPSIILQQGGYFLSVLSYQKEYQNYNAFFKDLAKASVDFWANRSLKKGAFEEYYPWENGYPPLAFSSLAAAKIIDKEEHRSTKIDKALKIAANKLQNRFESRAANQQVAGLAALAVIRKLDSELVSESSFENIVQKTLDLQNKEGWFMEYDGPDLGYLSVTLDCLWDLYDYTKDTRFLNSVERAFEFLSGLVISFKGNIGMHNSRNTDYIVPYGLTRFIESDNKQTRFKARQIIEILYNNIEDPNHFFSAIDDRYWSHYIGHSIVRAHQILAKVADADKNIDLPNADQIFYENSGYKMMHNNNVSVLISSKKGGIVTIKKDKEYFTNFGLVVFRDDKQFVNHWWDDQLIIENSSSEISIKGYLAGHIDNNSSPFKHMALRLLSFTFGHHIISFLKNQLIFKNKKSKYPFERKIILTGENIVIKDKISNITQNEEVIEAPRFSKRHVASADSFHKEDAILNTKFKVTRSANRVQSEFLSELIISYKN